MDRTNPELADALRSIPSVDTFLRRDRFDGLQRTVAVREARGFLAGLREDLMTGRIGAHDVQRLFESGAAEQHLIERCRVAEARRHRRVVNATGIVLHTGIGRAPLAPLARDAVAEAAGHAVVEVDPETGLRNQREEHVAGLLCALTGAGGALVVNNNAAMVNLVLRALGEGTEVVVSRGELVEIGGGFRMPDVMREAGCRMVEVGTTNRTHIGDFERAITESTGILMKVHPSNFRILGFHTTPTLAELVEVGRRRHLLVFEDLGSGLLLDRDLPGLEDEPKVIDSVRAGTPLVCFSGDKLLGGPQCGILVGDRELVGRVRAHPLYRAFRVDKLTLAALEATLLIYRDGDPSREIPTLFAISRPADELRQLALRLAALLDTHDTHDTLEPAVVPSESFVGSGASPARPLPSFAVALGGGEALAAALRGPPGPGIFTRIENDQVLLDLRTLVLEDLDEVGALVRQKLDRRVSASTDRHLFP